jgi:hypothetical protein
MILKIISQKNWRKNWRFVQNTANFWQKLNHNIVFFRKKRRQFRRKFAKIVENCDHTLVCEYSGFNGGT